MIFTKEQKLTYAHEISSLYDKYSLLVPKTSTLFGIITKDELRAIGSAKCYMGHWYLRAAAVKQEHWGKGYQRELLRERINYLKGRTTKVRAAIHPTNVHSLNNILALDFEFVKSQTYKDGKTYNVYELLL